MSDNQRTIFWLTGLVAAAVLSWVFLAPTPRFDTRRFESLTGAGQFDDAEALVEGHLKRAPGDAQAQFLLAQLLIERTDRDRVLNDQVRDETERALAALDRIGDDRSVAPALVELVRGKALYRLGRWDAAETSWLDALRLDPSVPEAGWALLDLYYLELRRAEARTLALSLLPNEPSRRDRAQLLLELTRQDAIRPDPQSLVDQLAPALRAEPGQLQAGVALGLAKVRSSQVEPGLEQLRQTVDQHPESPIAWDGLLTGLDLANRPDEVGEALGRVPRELRESPRFARHVGLAAQGRNAWGEAASAYQLAMDHDPGDFETAVRLARALKFAERTDDAVAWEHRIARHREASASLLALYDEANAVPTLGEGPHDALYERLASARERMWHPNEATAWRAMIGQGPRPADDPDQPEAAGTPAAAPTGPDPGGPEVSTDPAPAETAPATPTAPAAEPREPESPAAEVPRR